MGNARKRLWQVFVDECCEFLIDLCTPLRIVARWIRRHPRK